MSHCSSPIETHSTPRLLETATLLSQLHPPLHLTFLPLGAKSPNSSYSTVRDAPLHQPPLLHYSNSPLHQPPLLQPPLLQRSVASASTTPLLQRSIASASTTPTLHCISLHYSTTPTLRCISLHYSNASLTIPNALAEQKENDS